MYAIRLDDRVTYLLARNLNDPYNEYAFGLGAYCANMRVHMSSRALVLMSIEHATYTILNSVSPWSSTRVQGMRDSPHGYFPCDDFYEERVGVIEDRVFKSVTDHNHIGVFLWDVSHDTITAPLCEQYDSVVSLNVAQWRGRSWLSKSTHWGAQNPKSRELCTFVNLFTDDSALGSLPCIAASENRLYGHNIDDNGLEFITALDPRESNVAREVYRDDEHWDDFRDAPNGLAVVVVVGDDEYYHINIFDERACAMIGTSMLIKPDEYLFCPRVINEIGVRFIPVFTCM